MSKKMTFYTAGRPYVLANVQADQAEDLAGAIKRAWESGKTITFSYKSDDVDFLMRSDLVEAMSVEEWNE